jgi:prealbumin domain-containing protein
MTMSASRGTRLLIAATLACMGLALSAQAANATFARLTIVKINQGGDQNDAFGFHPQLVPSRSDVAIKAGEANRQTWSIECNVDRPGRACNAAHPTLKVTELPKPGYTLLSVRCVHTVGGSTYAGEPPASSPAEDDTTVNGATIDVKAALKEWIKCYFTNAPVGATARINVTKRVLPAFDPGTFDLLIDGQPKATGVGDGGTTGWQTVPVGTHAVGEAGSAATSLADYDATVACADQAPGHTGTTSGTGTSLSGLAVAAGDQWACVITNTRKSQVAPPGSQPPAPVEAQSPAPQLEVSPETIRPGTARFVGPTGCPTTRVASATVAGKRIAKVTFFVDGKKVKTLTKPNGKGGRWTLPLTVRTMAFGTHRVQARVEFAKSTGTKPRTLQLSFSRCHRGAVTPTFTG